MYQAFFSYFNNLRQNIEIAYGYTKFDYSTDTCFEDMFNRVDSLMYIYKRELKGKKLV